MLFESNGPILRRILKKRDLQLEGSAQHREIRLVVLALSGVFRGVYGAGQICAMQKTGLMHVPDHYIAVSTSAPAVAYGLAGQAEIGKTIYWDECLSGKFVPVDYLRLVESVAGGIISRLRHKKPESLMDIEYLCNEVFRNPASPKVLNQKAAIASRSRLHIAATRCMDGEGVLLDAKKTKPDLVEAIRAGIAVPGVSNGKVAIEGLEYIDGVGSIPFPVRLAIREYEPTDILVLANRPSEEFNLAEIVLTELATTGETVGVREAFRHREARFKEDREYLQSWSGNWGVIWSDREVNAVEIDRLKLQSACMRAEHHFLELIRKETGDLVSSERDNAACERVAV